MAKQEFLRLPVVSAGAEFLVMGYLMRRNILAYINGRWTICTGCDRGCYARLREFVGNCCVLVTLKLWQRESRRTFRCLP